MKKSPLPSSLPTVCVTQTATENQPAPKEHTDWLESLTRIEPLPSELKKQKQPASVSGAWGVFFSTFLTIFVAEMGDKTQLATLLMSAQSQSPWVVFAGSATALIATSLAGVLLGRWLAKCLAPKTLEVAAGTLLLFISVLLLWDVVHF